MTSWRGCFSRGVGKAEVARQGTLPLGLVGVLLLALAVVGAVVSWLAVSFIQRLPLVESLRAE